MARKPILIHKKVYIPKYEVVKAPTKVLGIDVDEYESKCEYNMELYNHILDCHEKIDFNEPNKKSYIDRLLKTPLAMTTSPCNDLYRTITFACASQALFRSFIDKLDGVISLYTTCTVSPAPNPGDLERIEAMKKRCEELYNRMATLLKQPEYQKFMYYWRKYINDDYHFPKVCPINDEAYKYDDYKDVLKVDDINIFDYFNDINNTMSRVTKYSSNYFKFFNYCSAGYNYLTFSIYNHDVIERIIKVLEETRDKIINANRTLSVLPKEIQERIDSLTLLISEFHKFNWSLQSMLFNKKLTKYNKRYGGFEPKKK